MEKKYILTLLTGLGIAENENGAWIKPKRDIRNSLVKNNFIDVLPIEKQYYNIDNEIILEKTDFIKRLIRKIKRNYYKIQNLYKLRSFFKKLNVNDTLLLQYPFYGKGYSIKFTSLLFEKMATLKIHKKAILIHDLESLNRGYDCLIDQSVELEFIKSFDTIIVHNKSMSSLLKLENCQHSHILYLNIFDYTVSDNLFSGFRKKVEICSSFSVFYAGNIAKSKFIYDLNRISNVKFYLYGPNFDPNLMNNSSDNIFYKGVLTPGDLLKKTGQYSFGLVWDGDSISRLHGNTGDYMKYNSPYKFSSIIAAGVPIITSIDSGIAQYVLDNNLGIVLSSLEDLKVIKVSKSQYLSMLKSVSLLQNKIIRGQHIVELIEFI